MAAAGLPLAAGVRKLVLTGQPQCGAGSGHQFIVNRILLCNDDYFCSICTQLVSHTELGCS